MLDLPISLQMAGLGLIIGAAFGATARLAEFCTLGAIADACLAADRRRLRSWLLAIAVAILLTQAMASGGLINLDRAIYLTPDFSWFGAIVGGLCFGYGMALVGTCGYGSLVRLGSGDLRYLVGFIVLAVSAYMTLRGLFGVVRISFIEPTNIQLNAVGSQSLVDALAYLSNRSAELLRWPVVFLLVAGLLVYCWQDAGFRRSRAAIFGGLAMGVLVSAGWFATGVLGADAFEPAPLRSLTFVTPVGEALVYLMTFTGATANFGIGSVFGVVLGAFLVSCSKGELRIEGFDGRRELLRHLAGASLMGFGGVTALGCTIGQGLTGLSTLSLSAPIAFASIFLGAWAGLRYLATGSLWVRALSG